MTLWKLGCRWGSHTPLFYSFIKNKRIVVGWEDKQYNVGDWLLVADGHTVLGFAHVRETPKPCTLQPELKEDFIKYEIPFENRLIIAKADFIELEKNDQFLYQLQQGIVRVQNNDVRNTFFKLLKKYNYKMKLTNHLEILLFKKQIILQGPPGTGKTREAKLIAKKILNLENDSELQKSEHYKLIQFHPSYTYEDFVRGIVAKPNPEGEGIIYEAENKTLGHFAKTALDNYLASQGILNTNSDFENRLGILLDEINTKIDAGETYRFGDKSTAEIISVGSDYLIYNFPQREDIRYKLLFSDVEKIFNKKADIKIPNDLKEKEKELQLGMKGKYPYYFMILEKLNKILAQQSVENKVEELKNYILIIDEINRANLSSVLGELIYALEYRGEKVESIYDIKVEGNQLILPPNLFIIGTMNTSDRSVGHIDYAIRRRFAFIDVLPKVLEIDNFQVEAFKTISTLFIKNLDAYLLDSNVSLQKSDHLSEEFNPKDVWLGHSYFISRDEEFDIRKKYEIKPILEEYLKDGILKKSAEAIINGL
jgi:5-methylcytosine-specific restriction endonuclease McrBC GTP-binding regulatory subunit McrB